MTSSLIIDDYCFACGKKNSMGLKLEIVREESESSGKARCSFTLGSQYQGYGGMIHGGILATILDELMIYALFFNEIPSITAKVEVKYKAKVLAGEALTGEAWMIRDRGKMVEAAGKIVNAGGKTVALGNGLFYKVERVIRA